MVSPAPIHINQLPIASGLNNNDVFVVSQAGIDRQIQASFLKTIDWAAIPLATVLNGSDQVLILQAGETKKVAASAFGFEAGTRTWFYQATPPAGWNLLEYTGNALLAVKSILSTDVYYSAGNPTNNPTGVVAGTWLQPTATLTIEQIPAHSHMLPMTDRNGHSTSKFCAGQTGDAAFGYTETYPTAGEGSNLYTSNGDVNAPSYTYPETLPHRHDSAYRPTAYVGILCQRQ